MTVDFDENSKTATPTTGTSTSTTTWLTQVEQLASEVAQSVGCQLYDLEFVGLGAGRTLRVFIDRDSNVAGSDGTGAGIEDCSNVSRGLNEKLDADDVIPGGPYNLEVSTPGIDRVLKKLWHFEKVVGKKIWVKTREALQSYGVTHAKWAQAKQIEHRLASVEQENLIFETKETVLRIPQTAVEKAKVVFEMPKGQKK